MEEPKACKRLSCSSARQNTADFTWHSHRMRWPRKHPNLVTDLVIIILLIFINYYYFINNSFKALVVRN